MTPAEAVCEEQERSKKTISELCVDTYNPNIYCDNNKGFEKPTQMGGEAEKPHSRVIEPCFERKPLGTDAWHTPVRLHRYRGPWEGHNRSQDVDAPQRGRN